MLWTKKNSCEEFDHEKKIPAARKFPPHNGFFSLPSYITAREKSSTRAAKPRANITLWFAIAPAEIRTRQILRENRVRKQSILSRTNGTSYTYLV